MNRSLPLLTLLMLTALPGFADDRPGYEEWLQFKKEFAEQAFGATGMYAIRDMMQLSEGETAYVSATDKSPRWSKTPPKSPLVTVKYSDGAAMASGSQIRSTDLLQLQGKAWPLNNGMSVKGTLLRDKALKAWLYDTKLLAEKGFRELDYFAYDPKGRITAAFRRNEQPVAVSYLDSRDQSGTMYDVGVLRVQLGDKKYDLKTFSYRNDWSDIDTLLLLLRDGTSGKTTYGGGRVVDISIPKGKPPANITFDLNMAYSFLCAHSEFYNCPLVLTNRVDARLEYGEKYPPRSSATVLSN
ncbi:MAG: DUF1684 domain-containing protein [Steroidobacter sp.]